jgi:NADH-quinone oxidoreductase subunit J
MSVEALLFWSFTAVSVLGALGVLILRNPVSGAMALVGSFFGLAGLFLLLDAQLIAALQVLVYTGAIMVLFLFVIMLLNLSPKDLGSGRLGLGRLIALAIGSGVTVFLAQILGRLPQIPGSPPPDFGTVAAVGRVLYGSYTLQFEAVSLLLLVAIVAAVVVAKGRI